MDCLAALCWMPILLLYLKATHFMARTDYRSLPRILDFKKSIGRLARRRLHLLKLYFEIEHRPASSYRETDAMSRISKKSEGEVETPIHDESLSFNLEIRAALTIMMVKHQQMQAPSMVALKDSQKMDPYVRDLRNIR